MLFEQKNRSEPIVGVHERVCFTVLLLSSIVEGDTVLTKLGVTCGACFCLVGEERRGVGLC